ncbi:MAG: endolytic transglycosylase MltG [Thermoleophilia bacterium]
MNGQPRRGARQQGAGPHRQRRQRSVVLALLVGAVALVLVMALIGRSGVQRQGEVTIRIEPGTSSAEIARMLRDEDVIDSERDFLSAAADAGIAGELKAGTYRFTLGEPVDDILARLQQGLQVSESILSVPEGYTIREIAAELAAKTTITENQYLAAAVPGERQLPLAGAAGTLDLEGFLFPSTYDLEPGLTAATLVDLQLVAFKQQTASLPWEKSAALGLTPYEILTVASMVEREARVPEERPEVAAVIYNRLRLGMKLEVDATVQYAIGDWKQELTQQDLATDSPYNTRLYGGLPPGPICNPGVESIRAALEPAAVDYLFYVATGDAAGHHFFTSSFDEFLKYSNSAP